MLQMLRKNDAFGNDALRWSLRPFGFRAQCGYTCAGMPSFTSLSLRVRLTHTRTLTNDNLNPIVIATLMLKQP